MRIVILLDHTFGSSGDGRIFTRTAFNYGYWRRYLAVFDSVHVVARISQNTSIPNESARADGPDVYFHCVPHYSGTLGFAARVPDIQRAFERALLKKSAVLLRVPGHIPSAVFWGLHRRKYPFGLEVVGDPLDGFAAGSFKHPLRPLIRFAFNRLQTLQCHTASAISYVTRDHLQNRYPPNPTATLTNYSSADLPDDSYVDQSRSLKRCASARRICFVGSLEHFQKGVDILIKAVKECLQRGLDLEVKLFGKGKHLQELKNLASELGISDRICFAGFLSDRSTLISEFDQSDVFVLPSRTEGLPRALLEAMARGMPCLATSVGGIPELLEQQDMFIAGDVTALADKLTNTLPDSARLEQMSKRNLEKAREYSRSRLSTKRSMFYLTLRELTQTHLDNVGPAASC